jgi:hypothetical protein
MFHSSKKEKEKPPLFFCETCDAEVPRDARRCPKCGSKFSSVRCPYCDFVGDEILFKRGCPDCGHSAEIPVVFESRRPSSRSKNTASLPFWVFLLTAAIFTALLAALFFAVF